MKLWRYLQLTTSSTDRGRGDQVAAMSQTEYVSPMKAVFAWPITTLTYDGGPITTLHESINQ